MLTSGKNGRFGVTMKQAIKFSTRYLAVCFSETTLSEFKLDGKKSSINVFVIQNDNSSGIKGSLPDITDFRRCTSFNLKYAVVPSVANQSEIVVMTVYVLFNVVIQ